MNDPTPAHYQPIIAQLRGFSWGQNGNAKCYCPGHDDQHRSASVRIGNTGTLIIKCHAKSAGCTFDRIAESLGRKREEFFPPKDRAARPERKIEGYYEYLSEHGELLYRAVRAMPKDFWLERWDGAKWEKGLAGLLGPIPFHLPELVNSDKRSWVCVAEGEKKVLALEALGFVATCNAAGAEKWEKRWGPWFQDRPVAVFPDYDEAGYKHAGLVASCLVGYAGPVVIVELPGLRLKQDVVDWLAGWPDDPSLRRRAIAKAIDASPIFDNTDTQYRLATLRLHMARGLAASCLI